MPKEPIFTRLARNARFRLRLTGAGSGDFRAELDSARLFENA
jgi:hypothetical protein